MAELEEIAEFAEEAEDGFAEAAEDAEGLDLEQEEELQDEVEASKENAGKMQEVIKTLKNFDVVAVLKKFIVFVAEQAAIAVVFSGVNIVLKKILEQGKKSGSGDSEANKQKLEKTKALSTLIGDISTTSNTLTDWLKDHQSDTITIDEEEGISVPLTDIFFKYTKKMGDSMQVSYMVAQELSKKDDSGKAQFLVPTAGQMTKIIASSEDFISALDGFLKFAKQKESLFPRLKTIPLTQADLDKLNSDLNTIKELPY